MDSTGFTNLCINHLIRNPDYCGFCWIHESQHKLTLLGIWIIVDSTGLKNSANLPY